MENDEVIQRWQEKVQSDFGDRGRLLHYLLETMDNFHYRYLETSLSKDLRSIQLNENLWGAESFEPSMVEALKISHPEAHRGILELAKSVPKALGPKVCYRLSSEILDLDQDRGHLRIRAEIDWGYPGHDDEKKRLTKVVNFRYQELNQFRKELALKFEEACSIFL